MRFRALVITTVLTGFPVAAAAQLSPAQQAALTPRQVVDAPKVAIGAKVEWKVVYHHVYADVQDDGKVAHSRIAYEWRDPFGMSAPVLVIGPSLEETKVRAAAGSSIVLESEPCVIRGTVHGVAPSSGVDGNGGTAVILDDVSVLPARSGGHPGHTTTGELSHAFLPGQVFAPGQGVSLPVVVKESKPVYPVDAIASKREGTVELELIVSADGKVTDVRVTKSLDSGGQLDQAAIAAAKQWVFKPGAKDGVPVPTRVTLVLDFKVKK
jgi:TonB family protein